MKSWTSSIPFFEASELACQGTGALLLDVHLAVHLPYLRLKWGRPLSLTSACRSPEHNLSEGGHPRSLHLTDNPVHPTNGCAAVDVYWESWREADQLAFAKLAWSLGWAVGLHDTFCHIDRRVDFGLKQRVYLYGQWTGGFDREEVKSP